MALKKKGTPEKIKVVKESDLDKWKKLINSVISGEVMVIKNDKKKEKK